jgi:predicted GIY-YIG superfamily endonuclease
VECGHLLAWKRDWKIELVEQANPGWIDLWEMINA